MIEWSVATFDSRLALTVSFGGAGVVLAHMLSQVAPWVPVLFLDTGLLFEETYAFKNEFAGRYGLNVIDLHPREDPGPLYETDPDRFCDVVAALAYPPVKQKFVDINVLTVSSTPAEATAYLKGQMAKWGAVIKDANIKLE